MRFAVKPAQLETENMYLYSIPRFVNFVTCFCVASMFVGVGSFCEISVSIKTLYKKILLVQCKYELTFCVVGLVKDLSKQ